MACWQHGGSSLPKSKKRSRTLAVLVTAMAAAALASAAASVFVQNGHGIRGRRIPEHRRTALQAFTCPLRRLELDDAALVGAGYDLVDVRILTMEGLPVQATFMLDSGLTTNLVSPSFLEKLGLDADAEKVQGTALGGSAQKLRSTLLPGVELLGPLQANASCYAGVWEGDGGWRAWCSLNWDAWKDQASKSNSGEVVGEVEYSVLPSKAMTEAQLETMVGWRGVERVEGSIQEGDFLGKGVAVEPRGILSVTERYQFREDGEGLVDTVSGTRLWRNALRPSLPLPGPLHAACVPFAQEQIALRQGIKLDGMLGQIPLHQDFAVEIDPEASLLRLHPQSAAGDVAEEVGMLRVPGIKLHSQLFGVQLFHAPLARGLAQDQTHQVAEEIPAVTVPAMVDTGAASSVLNWPAAELLLGIRQGDRIVRDAPVIRTFGVGGGRVDMPLITVSLGLVAAGSSAAGGYLPLVQQPVRIAIGDAEVFADIVGRSDSGSFPFGLGPKKLKPAALIGQDLLSQQRHMLSAGEPALYMLPHAAKPSPEGEMEFVGEGDCVDSGGRRLVGVQKLGCTSDDAAWECLSLPAGACYGTAVTPRGRFQGLCYLFVNQEDSRDEELFKRGWIRYSSPRGQALAPEGAVVASADGTADAWCFKWRKS